MPHRDSSLRPVVRRAAETLTDLLREVRTHARRLRLGADRVALHDDLQRRVRRHVAPFVGQPGNVAVQEQLDAEADRLVPDLVQVPDERGRAVIGDRPVELGPLGERVGPVQHVQQ